MPAKLTRIVTPATTVEHIAVAVSKPSPDQTHAGIVYRAEDGTLKLLHLAWHCDLREDDFDRYSDRYVCVDPDMSADEKKALAGYLRRTNFLQKNQNAIPYNLQYQEGAGFDPDTGDAILPNGCTGMTCATAVVHIFRSVGIRLIDMNGWPLAKDRPDDLRKQMAHVANLANDPDPVRKAQAALITPEIGCCRVRPEEVGGACLEDGLRVPFPQCEPNGRLLVAYLDSHAPQAASASP